MPAFAQGLSEEDRRALPVGPSSRGQCIRCRIRSRPTAYAGTVAIDSRSMPLSKIHIGSSRSRFSFACRPKPVRPTIGCSVESVIVKEDRPAVLGVGEAQLLHTAHCR